MTAIFSVYGRADLVAQLRHKARGLVQVMVGDKALDLVDGDGLVDRPPPAGALGLAALVARCGRRRPGTGFPS